MSAKRHSGSAAKLGPPVIWRFRLYVADRTQKSLFALANLKAICEAARPHRCRIEVVDVCKHPDLARAHQIAAIPTLVRTFPLPMRTFIGDLSNAGLTMASLEL